MKIPLAIASIFVLAVSGLTVPQDGTRVMGGRDAIQGQLPFMVSVHTATSFLCSGVLIDEFWALTSASCIWDDQASQLKVLVGGVKYTGAEVGRYEIAVAEVIPHEDYLESNTPRSPTKAAGVSYFFFNNMALLRLRTAAVPSALVQPITLTDFTEITPPKTVARVAGWGGAAHASPNPTLQYSDNLETIETVECAIALQIEISDLDVCTARTAQATCEFDHGGALYKSDSSRGNVLIGIVNYAPCGMAYPNVYASGTGQRWWINKVTGF